MPKRPKLYRHIALDGPIATLEDGQTLAGKHVITGGSLVGRVLFTEPSPFVLVVGSNTTIKHCIFETL